MYLNCSLSTNSAYEVKHKKGHVVLMKFTGYSRLIKISRDLTMKPFKPCITALIIMIMLNSAFLCAETSVLFIGNRFTYGYGSATD
jgi:hypothetical protein